MKLWLDDERPAPEGWHWAKTASEAIETLRNNVVSQASLDHDLGFPCPTCNDVVDLLGNLKCSTCNKSPDGQYVKAFLEHNNQSGFDVVLWMCEHNVWPTDGITVHSWNAYRGLAMADTIDRHGPYDTKCPYIPY